MLFFILLLIIIIISLSLFIIFQFKYYDLKYLDQEPILNELNYKFQESGCEFEVVKAIDFSARILSIRDYTDSRYYDKDLVPYDIVFGWGNLTKKEYLENINITQNNRFFHYNYKDLNHNDFITDFDNFHIVNNSYLNENIHYLKRYNNLSISGYLVNIKCDNWNRNTSISFKDRSATSCEQLYITSMNEI